jgi:predicted nucleic acid-binding Zn ribbon protein
LTIPIKPAILIQFSTIIRIIKMPLLTFYCTTTECPENTGHFPDSHREIELLVKVDEIPQCEVCSGNMSKVIGAPGLSFSGRDWPTKEFKLDNKTRKLMNS